ncbi:hypothetical protein LSH36_74g12007 [Paralvinella palmiformis]|uniref:Methyltransferase domain-containing protein n=1 Tax=Paralvinella palmiformis TaxID=53620 RepID=A0AAD9K2N8_9ANNE|nr:hypothetical protein LSH36_74g12007 [Paralvinella palmiformis]
MAKNLSGLPNQDGVPDTDMDAYKQDYEAHRAGISTEECIKYYNRTAEKYEQTFNPDRYQGYVMAADMVKKYTKDDKSIKILDIGAGTGLLGEQLKNRDFTDVDGLEPSSEMLKIATEKGVYQQYYCDTLDGKNVKIPDDRYDVVVSSGAMGEGHIPCNGLCEMIRIVKQGGLAIIVMKEGYLELVMEYKDRLEPFMEELEKSGQWKQLERTVVSNYSFGQNGLIFVYKVLQSGFKPIISKFI